MHEQELISKAVYGKMHEPCETFTLMMSAFTQIASTFMTHVNIVGPLQFLSQDPLGYFQVKGGPWE